MNLFASVKSAFRDPRAQKIVLVSLFFGSIFLCISAFRNADVPFAETNSDGYIPLAISLYQHHVFSYGTTSPFAPEVAHAPGYPFFLAVTAAPWSNVYPALVLQIFLLAISAVVLYYVFEGIFSEHIRFFGALVFSIEPFTLYTATQPLSESVFLFLFLLSLLMLRRAVERDRMSLFFGAGLLIGLATMVRPILEYFAFVSIPTLGILLFIVGRKALRPMLLFFLGILLVLTPWAYRNAEQFGVWTLSTKGPYTLYFFNATEVLKYAEGMSGIAAHDELFQRAQREFPEVREDYDLRSPVFAPFLTKTALGVIGEHPTIFAKMYITSLGTFFLSDGYRLLWYEMSGGGIELPNITRALATGDLGSVVDHMKRQPTQALLFFLGFFFWGAMTLGAFLAPCIAWFLKKRWQALFSLAALFIMMYFALLTGPVAQARYRVVVTPFLFMLAAYTYVTIYEWYRQRRIQKL
jgi:hypothetical protein